MEFENIKLRLLAIFIVFVVGFLFFYENGETTTSYYSIKVTATYPHDDQAFTQGLMYHNGYLYESTGLYGSSSLIKTDLSTGIIMDHITLSDEYFGEGLTIIGGSVYQITWKESTCFVYSLDDLENVQSFTYNGEGWGLTNDGIHLILSNGTSTLSYFDPQTFRIVKTVEVSFDGEPVHNLNELEYVDGVIYANVWKLDKIIMIDSKDGSTVGWIDLEGLENHLDSTDGIDVLNGIAYNSDSERLLVTGKLWPNIFEIQLSPK